MPFLRAAVAALTLAVVLAPLSLARSADLICPGVTQDGYWITIEAPEFPAGPQTITDHEVNALKPNVIFVTNGVSVMETQDRGCSWQPRFGIGLLPSLEAPVSDQNSEIFYIQIPAAASTNNFVYLALVSRVAGVGLKPFIVGSDNYGTTWRAMNTGLETAVGEPLGIRTSESSPNFLYLQLQRPGVGGDALYASQTAGESWQQRSDGSSGAASDMTVDPLGGNDLWSWGAGGVYHSTDGGRTRAQIEEVPAGIPLVDVWHASPLPAQIMVYEPETGTFSVSRDGGRTWIRINGPLFGNAQGLTHATLPNDIVFSQHQGVWRLNPDGTWLEITPTDYDGLHDLQADKMSSPNIYGRAESTLQIFTGLRATADVDPFDPGSVGGAITEPTLQPAKVQLKLKPKQQDLVPFKLALPAEGTPLDVFFLVDTSESQDPSIAALRSGMQHIVDELAASGVDVNFGVGEYKDYPIPGYGDTAQGDFPYRLNRKIGPADAGLEEALERLEASGGGAFDEPESQLAALYQAATGAGDPGFVPQGQDAGFRSQALKVIVHITDAQFHKEAQHPAPPFDQVSAALEERGILQVGLSVYGPNGADGTSDLTDMAEQTDTSAPVGVDCDENGSIDVPAGTPLVCPITDSNYDGSLNLTPAIIATLKAVTQEVTVELTASGGTEVLEALSPEIVPAVDLKKSNILDFDVTFDCPRQMYGKTATLSLSASMGGTEVDTSSARIVCKRPPPEKREKEKPEPPPFIASAGGSVLAFILAPPAPPPPIVENITATQNVAQAQGAMATEHQEEVQLAVAHQRARFSSARAELYQAREEGYEMSAYRSPEERNSPALLYLSAGIMAAAYGLVAKARTRTRVAVARRKR